MADAATVGFAAKKGQVVIAVVMEKIAVEAGSVTPRKYSMWTFLARL
ncbi:MAG TPA: hypothetical protein VGH05_00070 [Buttiauxella sp.]|jgi:hypothetical protein